MSSAALASPNEPAAKQADVRIEDVVQRGDELAVRCSVTFSNADLKRDSLVVFDVYPASDPAHPERHAGYWSFAFKDEPIPDVVHVLFTFNLKKKTVVALSGPVRLVDSWVGDYAVENEYQVTVNLFNHGTRITHSATRAYIGRPRKLEEVERETTTESPELKSAIWFLTWKCNYKCAYCWEVQRIIKGELQPEPLKEYKVWLDAWNRLRPRSLDISGGEPFLQPDFVKFLVELHPEIKVAITTNLSFDVMDFVQKVPTTRIKSLTFSLHPTQKMSVDQFIGRLLLVKNRGFGPITVNFVTWPEQMWLIPKYRKIFVEEVGVRFHVDPYAATPHYPFTFTEKELAFIRENTEADRAHWFGDKEIFNVACSGGSTHLSVEPDGRAYRCINDKLIGLPTIGNILDPTFSLNKKRTFCSDFHRCPGCDRDKVDITRLENAPPAENVKKGGNIKM